MSGDREKLVELLRQCVTQNMTTDPDIWDGIVDVNYGGMADHLLANGVIVTPCVAMVEQFLKDGKLDQKNTAHNGKYAVVYVDKEKWGCPLIDITEKHYNDEKALKRIAALKEGHNKGC